MTKLNTYSLDLHYSVRLFVRAVAYVVTLGFASVALFFVGFHVIPVFADKVPQVFAESVVLERDAYPMLDTRIKPAMVIEEKKTLP